MPGPVRWEGGAIEINTVPRLEAGDARGAVYSRIPRLHFPVDKAGRAVLVQDVTYFSRSALSDAVDFARGGCTVQRQVRSRRRMEAGPDHQSHALRSGEQADHGCRGDMHDQGLPRKPLGDGMATELHCPRRGVPEYFRRERR